ncbi:magnesium and cobalt transport protein CorA [Nocardioides alkalitolerans]|uniref:magnesium and cobalt transport protein CorA n=1 Tax=Nocardioides alkalitolerans TaxID=281714 RepID=UPI00041AD0F4|nr:magnesium and cobalt transport protein CorA [Nocardioides alkalitolerans]
MVTVQNAVYCPDGSKLEPESLVVTFELVRERHGMGWIGLYRPTADEISAVAEEFELHHLAVEDAVTAHQRPKLEQYGPVLFTVLRPARLVGDDARVEIGEVHVFAGPDFVVTIRHAESPDIGAVRRRLEHQPELLARGPSAVLYAVFDQVVDEYAPVVTGVETAVDVVEAGVFAGEEDISRRIYDLSLQLNDLDLATRPLPDMVAALSQWFADHDVDQELARLMRDVDDHVQRVVDRIERLRTRLQNILTVDATLVAQRQNRQIQELAEATYRQSEQVKRISSWAAILFAPTLVPTVYGMNFTHMPELTWTFGYPMALLLMVAMFGLLHLLFRRRGWL